MHCTRGQYTHSEVFLSSSQQRTNRDGNRDIVCRNRDRSSMHGGIDHAWGCLYVRCVEATPWDCGNGHSHIQLLLVGSFLSNAKKSRFVTKKHDSWQRIAIRDKVSRFVTFVNWRATFSNTKTRLQFCHESRRNFFVVVFTTLQCHDSWQYRALCKLMLCNVFKNKITFRHESQHHIFH